MSCAMQSSLSDSHCAVVFCQLKMTWGKWLVKKFESMDEIRDDKIVQLYRNETRTRGTIKSILNDLPAKPTHSGLTDCCLP